MTTSRRLGPRLQPTRQSLHFHSTLHSFLASCILQLMSEVMFCCMTVVGTCKYTQQLRCRDSKKLLDACQNRARILMCSYFPSSPLSLQRSYACCATKAACLAREAPVLTLADPHCNAPLLKGAVHSRRRSVKGCEMLHLNPCSYFQCASCHCGTVLCNFKCVLASRSHALGAFVWD